MEARISLPMPMKIRDTACRLTARYSMQINGFLTGIGGNSLETFTQSREQFMNSFEL